MSKQFIEPLDSRRMMYGYGYGDSNLSGNVSLDDFTTLAAFFGLPGQTWYGGDFNYDGAVSLDDFTALAGNFGLTPEVSFALDGDRNADKAVNAADFDFIRNNPSQFASGVQIAASAGFGDANMDGRIDKFDFRSLGNSFNQFTAHVSGWSKGDFTMNGRVTIKDFTLAAQNVAERD